MLGIVEPCGVIRHFQRKILNKGLQAEGVDRKGIHVEGTSSSAVEQPVYTGSVGGSIPSSCTNDFTEPGADGFSRIL